jgi:hypothetical protein
VAKDEAPLSTKSKAVSVGEIKEAGISLSVLVKDTGAAGKEVEKTVERLSGRIIKTESLNIKKVFIVKLSSSKFKDLVEKLQQVGEVKEKGLSPDQAGDIDIKIELLESRVQR